MTVKRALLALILLCVSAQATVLYLFWDRTRSGETIAELAGDAQRGAYLAEISGCISCHTDQENGGAFLAGGSKLVSGMGTFYPPNITSDRNAGIGLWNIETFANAVKRGVSPNGLQYYPVFPYWAYSGFSNQDIADLWAAFRTSTPSGFMTPGQKPTFPLGNRRLLNSWARVFGNAVGFEPSTDKSDAWNRGSFIVNGPGACRACHRKQGMFYAWTWKMLIADNSKDDLIHGVPDISPTALRERGWDRKRLIAAFRKGIKSQDSGNRENLAIRLAAFTKRLSDEDLNGLAEYLLDGAE